MSEIIMPYVDYKKYPYAFQPNKTEIVDVIQKKENSKNVWLNVEYIKINEKK